MNKLPSLRCALTVACAFVLIHNSAWAEVPKLSERIANALQNSTNVFKQAAIETAVAWTFHGEDSGPHITSESVVTLIDGNRYREERVSVFGEPGGSESRQKSASAFDGSAYFIASLVGERSVVTKFLGENPADVRAKSIELRLSYLQALGLNAPDKVNELIDWQPLSAILQAHSAGKLIGVEEGRELVTLRIEGAKPAIRSEYALDAKQGYALVTRKDFVDDQLVYELTNAKFAKDSQRKVWYPQSSNFVKYSAGKPLFTLSLTLKKLRFQIPTSTSFDLEPKTAGSLIADRSDPASSKMEGGQIAYKIGASGERLQAAARSVTPRSHAWKFLLSVVVVGTIVAVAVFWKRTQ